MAANTKETNQPNPEQAGALARLRELTDLLNRASRAYYAQDTEIMSNLEYDALYDQLQALEEETGIVLADSPTVNVGYASVDELPKEAHERPMLSLDKTKDREALRDWLGGQKGLLSWKLDGLTVVLTYQDGRLEKAVTRGNGQVGEVITPNPRPKALWPMCAIRIPATSAADPSASSTMKLQRPEMSAFTPFPW